MRQSDALGCVGGSVGEEGDGSGSGKGRGVLKGEGDGGWVRGDEGAEVWLGTGEWRLMGGGDWLRVRAM